MPGSVAFYRDTPAFGAGAAHRQKHTPFHWKDDTAIPCKEEEDDPSGRFAALSDQANNHDSLGARHASFHFVVLHAAVARVSGIRIVKR